MANFGFSQVPCSKCGTIVWISPQVGYGVCPSCHTQNQLGPGAAQAMPPAGGAPMGAMAPQAFPMPQAGFPVGRVIGGVLAAVLIGGASIGYSMFKGKFVAGKNKATYTGLGLDDKKPDGDTMISSVASHATKWKKDAHWWSCNFQAVRADGTVDVSKGAVVQYISPSGVTKKSKKLREDSVRKFVFNTVNVDYTQQWDAINEWKNVEKPASPKCSIKDLTKLLAKEGLKGDKTVRITFDPKWDWTNQQMWHVIGEDPKIDARYAMSDCSKIEKPGEGGGDKGGDE